jgi:hypothetical protein
MHFKLTKGRLAKLFRAVDTAGTINMTPIQGGPEQAIPIAIKRFAVAIAALPIDERTIEAADVWYDGTRDRWPTVCSRASDPRIARAV